MKTIELYEKSLSEIRYEMFGGNDLLSVKDYEQGSPEYNYIAKVNDALNKMSTIIDMMRNEIKLS